MSPDAALNILSAFNTALIFNTGESLARLLYMSATPVLMMIAILLRWTETQMGLLKGQGSKTEMLVDIFKYVAIITMFFALAGWVGSLLNVFYTWFASVGSIGALAHQVGQLQSEILQKGATLNLGNDAKNALNIPGNLVMAAMTKVFYFVLMMLALGCVYLSHIIVAIGYEVGFCYAMIALPLSISRSFNMMKAWSTFMKFILLWPIVEAMSMGFFNVMFSTAAQQIINNSTTGVAAAASNEIALNILFSMSSMFIIVMSFVSPMIARHLATNTDMSTSFLAPFVATGAAAVAAAKMAITKQSAAGGGAGGASPSASSTGGGSGGGVTMTPTARSEPPTAQSTSQQASKPTPETPTRNKASQVGAAPTKADDSRDKRAAGHSAPPASVGNEAKEMQMPAKPDRDTFR